MNWVTEPGQFLPLFLLLFLFLCWCQTLGVSQVVHGNGQEDIQEDVCLEFRNIQEQNYQFYKIRNIMLC